jgi:hypothetical protein
MTPPASSNSSSPTLIAYPGDAKALLAFDLPKRKTKNLAGFTILCEPAGQPAYYLHNSLRFKDGARHAQVATELPTSSINAPFHKFRWLHVPGSLKQGSDPFYGRYTYSVTPRYFDDKQSLLPLDPALTGSVHVNVAPFQTASLELGFTRGYVQSQGYVNHFGPKAVIRPPGNELLFDTAQTAGTDAEGHTFTYADQYRWLGFTARTKLFELLSEVLANPSLRLDMFAYDLNEPDLIESLLELAKQGRLRIILDNAALHHSTSSPKPEDQFEQLFKAQAAPPAEIKRGHFGRYSHDKVLVVSDATGPQTVLTGSTNFSVTGLYVNANHVLIFRQQEVAAHYKAFFDAVWIGNVNEAAYLATPFASESFKPAATKLPTTSITFAPHDAPFATAILDGIVTRINKEATKAKTVGSVLFAVMAIDKGTSPVYVALNTLHSDERIFSYGISDSPAGISLYKPGRKSGVLVTGKPVRTQMPPPFSQVPSVGAGHQIHHKFVVCGFNGSDPTVFCGSSNLALGGEQLNGDNLLEIHDRDVATVFAIEAMSLVDHFQFLDRSARGSTSPAPSASRVQAAEQAQWFLGTTAKWAEPYYDPNDLHFVDRRLFAAGPRA